mgnify:CR=1 FL=1
MKRYLLIGGLGALCLIFLVFQRLSAIQNAEKPKNMIEIQREKGIPVLAGKPIKKTMEKKLELTGTIIPFKDLEVSARRGDEVTSSSLILGKKVRRGEVVAQLFDRNVKAQLAAAEGAVAQTSNVLEKLRKGTRSQEIRQCEAALKSAQAQYENAEKEYARMQKLETSGAITRQNADRIISARDQAIAGLEGAKQRLSLAREGPQTEDIRGAEAAYRQALARKELEQIALEQSVITAPIDGFIDKVFVEPGEQVGNNKPLFNIVDIDRLFLQADVPLEYINQIAVGQKVTITTGRNGETREGTVREITPNADPISRTYLVKVFVENPDLKMKPGMFANAVFRLERHSEALVVPRESLVEREKKTGVFVVRDRQAQFQPVVPGIQDNEEVEIASGVSETALVISQGQKDVQPGSLVALQEEAAK